MHRSIQPLLLVAFLVALTTPAAGGVPDPNSVTELTVEQAERIVATQAAKPRFPAHGGGGRKADIDRPLMAAGMTAEQVEKLRALPDVRKQAALRHAHPGDPALLAQAIRRQETPEWIAARNLFSDELFLPAVKDVSAPVATVLASFPGNLFLPGLESLSAEAAAAFAEHGGQIIGFEGLQTLSVDAAKAFAAHGKVLILTVRTGLTPEVARALATKPGLLRLENIGTLSAQTASTLAAARGLLPISLAGFTSISPEVAAIVAKMSSHELDLSSVLEISPEAIAALKPLRCHRIAFGGETLSPAAAEAAASLTCPDLDLSGVKNLPAAAAAKLAAFRGHRLCLNGLDSLDVETARALAGIGSDGEGKGKRAGGGHCEIQLAGLRSIEPKVAEAFSRHTGTLYLGGLREIDAATATALASRSMLDLSSLTTLTAEAAAALGKHGGQLRLSGITELSPEVAAALSGHRGMLDLSGLATVEPAAAAALVANPHHVALNGLVELTPEVASALAGNNKGSIQAGGVASLSAETARALAGWEAGHLALNGLKRIDPEAVAILANRPQVMFGFGMIDTLTPELIDAFAKWLGVAKERVLVLQGVTALEQPDAVAVAKSLAKLSGKISLPSLRRVSPKTLTALAEKHDLTLPPIDSLELIAEPDGSPTEDFVVSEEFMARQQYSPQLPGQHPGMLRGNRLLPQLQLQNPLPNARVRMFLPVAPPVAPPVVPAR